MTYQEFAEKISNFTRTGKPSPKTGRYTVEFDFKKKNGEIIPVSITDPKDVVLSSDYEKESALWVAKNYGFLLQCCD